MTPLSLDFLIFIGENRRLVQPPPGRGLCKTNWHGSFPGHPTPLA